MINIDRSGVQSGALFGRSGVPAKSKIKISNKKLVRFVIYLIK